MMPARGTQKFKLLPSNTGAVQYIKTADQQVCLTQKYVYTICIFSLIEIDELDRIKNVCFIIFICN